MADQTLTIVPRPIQIGKTIYIDIKKDENIGHNVYEVTALGIEFAVKIFEDDTCIRPANSRIVVKKLTQIDEKGDMYVEETIFDDITNKVVVRDYDTFEHKYYIDIVEAKVRVIGAIRTLVAGE